MSLKLARLLVPIAALVVLGLATANAHADIEEGFLTPTVVGYGKLEANGPTNGHSECASASETPGPTEGNPGGGLPYTCGRWDLWSTAECSAVSSEETRCYNILRATNLDAAGWRYDHMKVCNPSRCIEDSSFNGPRILTRTQYCDVQVGGCEDWEYGPWTATVYFVDTRAPSAQWLSAPADSSIVYSDVTQQQFTFSTDENQEMPTFSCERDDSGVVEPCLSGWIWGQLGDGIHKLCVKAKDVSGLIGSATCRTWQQETFPTVQVVGGPPASGAGAEAPFTYRSNKTTHAADGSTLGYDCKLDAADWQPCAAAGETYEEMKAGDHSFEVRAAWHGAFDASGVVHYSQPAKYEWNVASTCETDQAVCEREAEEKATKEAEEKAAKEAEEKAAKEAEEKASQGGGGILQPVNTTTTNVNNTTTNNQSTVTCRPGFKLKKVKVKVRVGKTKSGKPKFKFKKKTRCVNVKKAKKKKKGKKKRG